MRGIQCFVFCALLYSFQVDAFSSCDADGDCPDNAECDGSGDGIMGGGDGGGPSECECKEGFDEIDLPDITIDGKAATVCIDLGICSPFDNEVDDCGENGQCVIIRDKHGIYKAVCKCKYGYDGKFCDVTKTTSTPYSTTGTTKKPKPWILFGGGAILLAVLAGGAAVAASSFS
ncbi:uncharacterized protein LOC128161655 isoform X1 [Crassostrea angulata]|uniref:EGF-like domain-containing protein n=1 Tax=Magallana gigas TaxID=29159 RepID=A0A8W8LKZ4_MAGGI|nr:uncharacterized protein LOC117682529 isoform X2 [Crassostrea gigas]XP_034306180.1 uncharacterized protein LOC117682534 [Crassostrea gigas]XP_034306181.1 uncharacterized protein LOC117682534 [Crassostrea gigas]XP_052680935.1 uncharacterized protein LOC128161655 isoform X1 [Crassostrea angulata]